MSSTEDVSIHRLSNGLIVIVEEMPDFESAAFELHIPGGIAFDEESRIGSSLLLAELTTRGAGGLSSEDLSNAFDSLGIRHSESSGHERFVYRAALLKDTFSEALRLSSLMVHAPLLPEDEIESIRSILLQDIAALADNPSRRAMLELSNRYYPAPFNRPGCGNEEGLKNTTVASLRAQHKEYFAASGSILSVAGNVKTAQVLSEAEKNFGKWEGEAKKRIPFGKIQPFARHHLQEESAQLQIVLSHPSAPFGSPHYYAAKIAAQILSGGMFGRLFIEVREKRGLVYSVYASHSSAKEYGTVTAYAGTTPERAHETLEVMLEVMKGLRGTITEVEIKRAKANLKSSLVMGQEGTGARASSNAQDYWIDGRVRTLDEIVRGIDAVGQKELDAYLSAYPVEPFTLVTLGARKL
jgi:predicted Zn-dependent peptidase